MSENPAPILTINPSEINNVSKDDLKTVLKQKIAKSLEDLNQSSHVFDEMIKDYKTLYEKYINNRLAAEQTQRLNSMQLLKTQETFVKKDQAELEKSYNYLQEEYLKVKTAKEEAYVDLSKNLQIIVDLRNKLEQKGKQILGLSTENGALKAQNMALDKKNKELNTLAQNQEKELIELRKTKQRLEIEHKTLLDNSGKMIMEIDSLRNKILDLQENTINKMESYNELIESANQKKMAADLYFTKKSEEYKEINKNNEDDDLNKIVGNFGNFDYEINVPTKLKYKQKAHNRGITSVNFNNFGSLYITTGVDYIVRVYDAAKNSETNVFSGFSSAVSDACFDHNEQYLFAGSLDKTAKLWMLKNNKLLNTFTGHIDYINCVQSFNAFEHGLTGSSDRTIREWDFNTQNIVKKFNCVSECHSLSISDDDSFFLSGHMNGTVKLWTSNDKPEKEFELHEDKVLRIKMIKNENQFLTLGKDETIKLFDLRKEQPIYTVTSNVIHQHCESSIAVSPDKKYFAVGSTRGTIYILNLETGKLDSTINNKSNASINGLCWRPFNSQIYVGDSTGYLTIWGTTEGI